MRIIGHLRCLPIAIGILACANSSPSDNTSTSPDGDPGKAPSEFGTKCTAELVEEASNTTLVFEECTVSAGSVSTGGMEPVSHVFFTFRRLPQGARRMYVSLVVGAPPLAPGAHGSARAGAVEATLEDGRTFSAGDVRKEGALQLVIEQANTVGDDTAVFYVTGLFEAQLQNPQSPSSKVLFRARINKPVDPPTSN